MRSPNNDLHASASSFDEDAVSISCDSIEYGESTMSGFGNDDDTNNNRENNREDTVVAHQETRKVRLWRNVVLSLVSAGWKVEDSKFDQRGCIKIVAPCIPLAVVVCGDTK
jgi:hypothetical protein